MQSAAKKKSITRRELRAEMVIEPHLLSHLLVRCHGECRQFKMQSQAALAGCSVCSYMISVCHDCGGEETAKRGVLSHHRWWANQGPKRGYGTAHVSGWTRYQEEKHKRSKLKIVRKQRQPSEDGTYVVSENTAKAIAAKIVRS